MNRQSTKGRDGGLKKPPVGGLRLSPGFVPRLLAGLLFLFPAAGFAQTAQQMDLILDTEQVSFAQAAELVLPAAGVLEPGAGPEAAFERAREWLPRGAETEAPIRMGELSHLVMQSFGLSGGFMYALFSGPRYAYRALAWRRFLPVKADPYRTVTGEELLYITGQILSYTGDMPGQEEYEVE